MSAFPSDLRLAKAMVRGHHATRDGAGFRVDCGDGVTRWARDGEYHAACGLLNDVLGGFGGVPATRVAEAPSQALAAFLADANATQPRPDTRSQSSGRQSVGGV